MQITDDHDKDELRPLQHLHALNERYPQAWEMVDMFRDLRGKEILEWPDWCFLPMTGWFTIATICEGRIFYTFNKVAIEGMCWLATIGTWRYTQSIYRFDQHLLTELIKKPLTGNLSGETLFRLPEGSIYIETPGIKCLNLQTHGFWAHLEYDTNKSCSELILLIDTEKGLNPPFSLKIGPWTFQESIAMMLSTTHQCALEAGCKTTLPPDAIKELIFTEHLQPFVSLVLYICSQYPAAVQNTRASMPFLPPDKPTIRRVGESIG